MTEAKKRTKIWMLKKTFSHREVKKVHKEKVTDSRSRQWILSEFLLNILRERSMNIRECETRNLFF